MKSKLIVLPLLVILWTHYHLVLTAELLEPARFLNDQVGKEGLEYWPKKLVKHRKLSVEQAGQKPIDKYFAAIQKLPLHIQANSDFSTFTRSISIFFPPYIQKVTKWSWVNNSDMGIGIGLGVVLIVTLLSLITTLCQIISTVRSCLAEKKRMPRRIQEQQRRRLDVNEYIPQRVRNPQQVEEQLPIADENSNQVLPSNQNEVQNNAPSDRVIQEEVVAPLVVMNQHSQREQQRRESNKNNQVKEESNEAKPLEDEKKEGFRPKNELKTSILYKQMTCSGECQVCMEIKDISYVISPCGHDGYCLDCLTSLKEKGLSCPYCRGPIESFLKLYTCRQERVERQVVYVKETTKHPPVTEEDHSPQYKDLESNRNLMGKDKEEGKPPVVQNIIILNQGGDTQKIQEILKQQQEMMSKTQGHNNPIQSFVIQEMSMAEHEAIRQSMAQSMVQQSIVQQDPMKQSIQIQPMNESQIDLFRENGIAINADRDDIILKSNRQEIPVILHSDRKNEVKLSQIHSSRGNKDDDATEVIFDVNNRQSTQDKNDDDGSRTIWDKDPIVRQNQDWQDKPRNKVMMSDVSMYLTKSQMADRSKMLEEQKQEEEGLQIAKKRRTVKKKTEEQMIIKISDANIDPDEDEKVSPLVNQFNNGQSPFQIKSVRIDLTQNKKDSLNDQSDNTALTSQKKQRKGWFSKARGNKSKTQANQEDKYEESKVADDVASSVLDSVDAPKNPGLRTQEIKAEPATNLLKKKRMQWKKNKLGQGGQVDHTELSQNLKSIQQPVSQLDGEDMVSVTNSQSQVSTQFQLRSNSKAKRSARGNSQHPIGASDSQYNVLQMVQNIAQDENIQQIVNREASPINFKDIRSPRQEDSGVVGNYKTGSRKNSVQIQFHPNNQRGGEQQQRPGSMRANSQNKKEADQVSQQTVSKGKKFQPKKPPTKSNKKR